MIHDEMRSCMCWLTLTLLLLTKCVLVSTTVPAKVPATINIGGIFSKGRDGTRDLAEAAFHLAIEKINNDPTILPNTNLTALVRNSEYLVYPFGNIQHACNLISRGVVAIVGPTTSSDVKAVYPIAEGLHIPQFAPFATDPTLSQNPNTYGYLFKMSAPDSWQSRALIDIIAHFRWSRMAILTSLTDYGINGLQEFQRIAILKNWVISHVGRFLPTQNASSVDAREQLLTIRSKGVRLVILNCLAIHARYVLRQAGELGMTQSGWAWVVTDGVTALEGLYEDCLEIPPHLIGVIGTRPTVGEGMLFTNFLEAWNTDPTSSGSRGFEVNHHCTDQFNMASVLRTYDSVIAIGHALHNYLTDGHNLSIPAYPARTCSKRDIEKWRDGEKLKQYIRKVQCNGTMNYVNFTDFNAPDVAHYDIVNLRNRGFEKVGGWYGEGDMEISTRVFFPGNTRTVPTDSNLDLSNYTLKITTILDEPFVMMSDDPTKKGNDRYKGFCKDLLDKLQSSLDFKYEMTLVPDGQYGAKDEDSDRVRWNGMVGQLIQGKADVAVAPFTISYERQQYIAFTKPYLDLGLTILMKVKEPERSLFAFLDPFSYDLWMAILLAMLFAGMCVSVCSYLSPYGYYGAYVQRPDSSDTSTYDARNSMNLYNALWFSFASWMQQGADFNPRSISGRIVGGFWWMAVIIITANYTANLAAFLTVARMSTGISSVDDLAKQSSIPYGTVHNSQPESYFEQAGVEPYKKISNSMINVDNTTEGIKKVKEGNYAFIWDSAILEYAANKEPCDVQTVGRLFGKMGYGLGLPLHSQLTDIFSLEILKLRQSGYIEQLSNNYFTGICDKDKKTSTEKAGSQMSINNMAGVFYFMFAGFGFGFIIMLVEWCWASYKETTSVKIEPAKKPSWCQALRRRIRATSKNLKQCGRRTRDDDCIDYDNLRPRVSINQHFLANRDFPRARYEVVPLEDYRTQDVRRHELNNQRLNPTNVRANGPNEVSNTVSVY